MSTHQDAQVMPVSGVGKLRQDARDAAERRALQTHPDVVALRVERIRAQVDALMWAGLLLGLAFTMVNVQAFAAEKAERWSLPWLAAWLLDPMVSLVLVAVLRAEQVTARYQVRMHGEGIGPWVRRTKLFAFAATYTMNTWQSWADLHVSGIVLHSVPPALVYLAAETGPILRDRLTEAVLRAAHVSDSAEQGVVHATPSTRVNDTEDGSNLSPEKVKPSPSGQRASRPRPASARSGGKAAGKPRRGSREEYLSRARAAYQPGTVVTPAWVREVVPDISRGSSQTVAKDLNAELAAAHTATTAVVTDLTDAVTADVASTVDQPVEQERAA